MKQIPAIFEKSKVVKTTFGIFHMPVETMVKVDYETETHLFLTERTWEHRVPLKNLKYSVTESCGSPMCKKDHLWISVLSLPGHMIILPECIHEEHLKEMCEIDRISCHHMEREHGLRPITGYSIDDVKLEDLTISEYDIYRQVCLQLERYELLTAHDADLRFKRVASE